MSIESSYDEVSKDIGATEAQPNGKGLSPEEVASFCMWVKVVGGLYRTNCNLL